MNKVYAIEDEGNSAAEIEVFQNSVDENTSVCIVEDVFKKSTAKVSVTDGIYKFSDKRTTDSITSLELERMQHKSNAELRRKIFNKILLNEAVELSSVTFVFRTLATILFSIASSFVFTFHLKSIF